MALKTDYVDDELAVSMGGKRQFNIVASNGNILYENVHIEDTSKYSTVGDDFGAEDINETNEVVNEIEENVNKKVLVNTYYDDSVNKLYKVNSDGTKGEEIKMGMPIYDYEHPLHTFDANNLSYTLTKDAYLVGSISVNSGSTDVTIKNTVMATSNSYGVGSGFINVKVQSGSTITVTKACPALHVYDIEEQ